MQNLQNIRGNMSIDLFVTYCLADLPKNKQEADIKVQPKDVVQRLEQDGYSWYVGIHVKYAVYSGVIVSYQNIVTYHIKKYLYALR